MSSRHVWPKRGKLFIKADRVLMTSIPFFWDRLDVTEGGGDLNIKPSKPRNSDYYMIFSERAVLFLY